jgi:hypothetical protein
MKIKALCVSAILSFLVILLPGGIKSASERRIALIIGNGAYSASEEGSGSSFLT